MTALRQQLRSKGAMFKVIKNTFARIAADESGKSSLKDVMNGPIGFVVSDSDPAEAAKALVKYASENDLPINIIGGMLNADLLDQSKIKSLATLPSKEELLSKMMGSMKSPITGIVMVMNGPIRSLANVLQRHVENNQENSAA
jgi:large subunit ribosomal protein L10